MTIDPNNYTHDWKAISRKARERAGCRCEECGVTNGAVGYRDRERRFHAVSRCDRAAVQQVLDHFGYRKLFAIVLTVHHIDEDSMNNDPRNLVALCQQCHLDKHRKGQRIMVLRKGKDN